MTYETIETRMEGRIGILMFNRPKVLNAINTRLMAETSEALRRFIADPAVLAIVVGGNGRAFSAGFDMKESAERGITGTDQWRRVLEQDFDFIMQFWDSPKPTVAAVHGFCLAGAFELALACDITVAAEGTRFGEPEARFGSGIVALLLPWFTSPKVAKELLLTGSDQVDAARAHAMGIVNHVVPQGRELEKALAIAADLAAAAPRSWECARRCSPRWIPTFSSRARRDRSAPSSIGSGASRASRPPWPGGIRASWRLRPPLAEGPMGARARCPEAGRLDGALRLSTIPARPRGAGMKGAI
jgi:enoyl-CoA hydratase